MEELKEKNSADAATVEAGRGTPELVDTLPPLSRHKFIALILTSLGVIFGDIGTSPLYVLGSIFRGTPPTADAAIGSASLVVWSLFLVVALKYVFFVLQADKEGEGGTFALTSLLSEARFGHRRRQFLAVFSILAASMVLGDGAITPAISVLSAVEGLEVYSPSLSSAVVPVTIVILVFLFLAQQLGTGKVGIIFAPIMFLWFFSLFSSGVYWIVQQPAALRALNPWEGIYYAGTEGSSGYAQLGSVFLAVTGAEALYADMGHFRLWPIRVSTLGIVIPALVVNYLGQAAMLVNDPSRITNAFYYQFASELLWPMVGLATLATIIASQAMITGCFSLIAQAVNLDYCPPLTITYTSSVQQGQVYIPVANYLLLLVSSSLVLGFQHASALGGAYGVTVSTVMILTGLGYMLVMRYTWNLALWRVGLFGLFLIADIFFWGSNLMKVPSGGWVSLVMSTVLSFVMICWYMGQKKLKHWYTQNRNVDILLTLLQKELKIRFRSTSQIQMQNSKPTAWETLEQEEKQQHLNPSEAQPSPAAIEPNVEEVPIERVVSTPTLSPNKLERQPSTTEMKRRLRRAEGSRSDLKEEVKPAGALRLPGVGVFIAPKIKGIPPVFYTLLMRMHAMPETIIFFTAEVAKVPTILNQHRVKVTSYGENIYRIVSRYGYAEHDRDILQALSIAQDLGLPKYESDNITFFINNENIEVLRETRRWLSYLPMRFYRILSYVEHLFTRRFTT